MCDRLCACVCACVCAGVCVCACVCMCVRVLCSCVQVVCVRVLWNSFFVIVISIRTFPSLQSAYPIEGDCQKHCQCCCYRKPNCRYYGEVYPNRQELFLVRSPSSVTDCSVTATTTERSEGVIFSEITVSIYLNIHLKS